MWTNITGVTGIDTWMLCIKLYNCSFVLWYAINRSICFTDSLFIPNKLQNDPLRKLLPRHWQTGDVHPVPVQIVWPSPCLLLHFRTSTTILTDRRCTSGTCTNCVTFTLLVIIIQRQLTLSYSMSSYFRWVNLYISYDLHLAIITPRQLTLSFSMSSYFRWDYLRNKNEKLGIIV